MCESCWVSLSKSKHISQYMVHGCLIVHTMPMWSRSMWTWAHASAFRQNYELINLSFCYNWSIICFQVGPTFYGYKCSIYWYYVVLIRFHKEMPFLGWHKRKYWTSPYIWNRKHILASLVKSWSPHDFIWWISEETVVCAW